MIEQKISKRTRLGSMFIDHLAMTLIAMLFVIPAIFLAPSNGLKDNITSADSGLFNGVLGYISLIGFAIYFCKDIINGRSIAKRILKLQVVDNTTGLEASPLKCLVRNLFCILWPLEIIVSLSNTSRRIGDRVAGTKVIPYTSTTYSSKPDFMQIGLAFILSYVIIALLMVSLGGFPN